MCDIWSESLTESSYIFKIFVVLYFVKRQSKGNNIVEYYYNLK